MKWSWSQERSLFYYMEETWDAGRGMQSWLAVLFDFTTFYFIFTFHLQPSEVVKTILLFLEYIPGWKPIEKYDQLPWQHISNHPESEKEKKEYQVVMFIRWVSCISNNTISYKKHSFFLYVDILINTQLRHLFSLTNEFILKKLYLSMPFGAKPKAVASNPKGCSPRNWTWGDTTSLFQKWKCKTLHS